MQESDGSGSISGSGSGSISGSGSGSGSGSRGIDDDHKAKPSSLSGSIESSLPQQDLVSSKNELTQIENRVVAVANESAEDATTEISLVPRSRVHAPPSSMQKSTTLSNGPMNNARPKTVWGRTSVSI